MRRLWFFEIEKYTGIYDVMHCNTEEKANAFFLQFLVNIDHPLWGEHLEEGVECHNRYSRYREETCYAFNDHTYCSLNFFKKKNSLILEFDDFEWPNFKEVMIDSTKIDSLLAEM